MPAPAKMRLRAEKHLQNITKRGNVPTSTMEKEGGYRVGPILLGFFIFVVVGSAILEIIRASQGGGI